MKVLVVGLNPSRKNGKSPTLKRLYTWLDTLNLPVVSFTNVYESYDIEETEPQDIKSISKGYDKVIVLGARASNVVRNMDVDHYCLPHPSGRNLRTNDPIFIHQALEGCNNYLRGQS